MNKVKSFINKHYAGLSIIAICTVAFLIIGLIDGFAFATNDDKTINNILSGTFTNNPSNQTIYVGQIICYPLMLLYKFLPGIPFYGLLLILTMYICSITIGLNIIRNDSQKNYCKTLLLFVIIFIGLLSNHIANLQYTVTAAFPVFAIVSLILKKRENTTTLFKVFFFLYIAFLMILSCAIRFHVFVIGIPFIGLAVLIKLLKNKTNRFFVFQFVIVIVSAVFALGINIATNHIVLDKDAEYQAFIEYNNVRSDLFDTYGFPSYTEAPELYSELGIDEETLTLISGHYMLDIKEANYENFKKIRDYQVEHYNVKDKAIYAFISIFMNFFTENLVELLVLVVVSIYAILSFKNKLKTDKFFFCSLLIGSALMSFIIAFLLKFPARIASPILLSCIVSILAYRLYYAPLEDLHFNKAFILVACIAVAGNTFYTSAHMLYNKTNNEYKAMLEEIVTEDNDYIYFAEDHVAKRQTENALRPPYHISNYFYSTWSTRSPYSNSILHNLGYLDLDDMFAHCDNLKIALLEHETLELLEHYFTNTYSRHLHVLRMIKTYYFDQELYICEVI